VRKGLAHTPGEMRASDSARRVPPTRDVSGHIAAMAMYAGESVALVNSVLPASQLVRTLGEGAEALFEKGQVARP